MTEVTGGDFYDLSSPIYPQQGDIFPNVPLISPPSGPHLVILRETDGRPWNPRAGMLQATSEELLNAFDGTPEYIAASAERALAAILTQTCDLVDQEQWLVSPLREIEGTHIDEGNLFAGKFANLFGMPKHPLGYFEVGYLDLAQCFPVHRESVARKNRIASLTASAQHALTDKFSETMTRLWGYAPGEIILVTGKYRCIRCFQFFGLVNTVWDLQAGDLFPDCPDCLKIKKSAQWRLLRRHKKY
jgi:hypothetical protein